MGVSFLNWRVMRSCFSRVKCFLLGCQVLVEIATRDVAEKKHTCHIPAFFGLYILAAQYSEGVMSLDSMEHLAKCWFM